MSCKSALYAVNANTQTVTADETTIDFGSIVRMYTLIRWKRCCIIISIDEVNKTIIELEQHDTTYATCEKLAWLYIVKDHIDATHVSTTSAPRDESAQSARVVAP